jgi:hypothetical protein
MKFAIDEASSVGCFGSENHRDIKSPAPGDGDVVRRSIRPNGCKFDQGKTNVQC